MRTALLVPTALAALLAAPARGEYCYVPPCPKDADGDGNPDGDYCYVPPCPIIGGGNGGGGGDGGGGPVPYLPEDLIQFDMTLTPEQLVGELISVDADLEFQNVQGSSHLGQCAGLFTNGHAAGVLYEKNPITGALETDSEGNYIPSDTYAVPDRGVMLATGDPAWFNGHGNIEDDRTTDFEAPGDADLKATVDAINGEDNSIFDACVLEFEFRCTNDTYVPKVSFNYIWGSEEYLEYVGSKFNDAFRFYLNGENIAKVPNSDTDSDLVSINNVNYDSNARYFNQNDPGSGNIEDPDGVTTEVLYPHIQADGFTDVLTAEGEPNEDPDEWNAIKLVVGDVGDAEFDSYVLLESLTFTCRDITASPSSVPSSTPSRMPSSIPSWQPSTVPSSLPSSQPSAVPTIDCDPNARRTYTGGGYRGYECICNGGWRGDGKFCEDINECYERTDLCHDDAWCSNTLGSYSCDCKRGYTGNGFVCDDIDECAGGVSNPLNNCHEYARCTNVPGSFECACPPNWLGDGVTNCETKPPTASPTSLPSSLPSMQPSIVEQVIIHDGSISLNVDMCALGDELATAYGVIVQNSIQNVTNCYVENGCVAALTDVCGDIISSGRRLRSPSRRLQNSGYQVSYQVTQTFTCEYSTCSSPSDYQTTESIVDSIISPVESSLAGNEFLIVLSTNLKNSGSFSAEITACLAVWGVVSVREFAVNPDLARGNDGKDTTGTPRLFYPDWETHLGTCLQDGNQPVYMEMDPATWLFDNLQACCDRYYAGWNHNKCMNQQGSGLWYVSHQLEKCVTDCNEDKGGTCGGLANPVADDIYSHPRSCCEKELPWRFLDFCESESLQSTCYQGSGKYYRGDYLESTGSIVCVKDCDPKASGDNVCGGRVEDTYIDLYDTPEECCSTEYNWMTKELCVARTLKNNTDLFWPDKTNAKCILDNETPAQDLSISVYTSMIECCKEGVYWVSQESCFSASGGSSPAYLMTDMFYIDWESERCIQIGAAKSPFRWDTKFDTLSDCCDILAWIPGKDCSKAIDNA